MLKKFVRKMLPAIIILILSIVLAIPVLAAQVFVEGFGDPSLSTDGTVITTSNTALTYVRIGTGGGAIESNNPSTLGGGVNNNNSMIFGGTTSGSPNCVGVTGIPSMNVTTLNLRLKPVSGTTGGDFIIRMGTGILFWCGKLFYYC